jgi:hypothetical protein
MSREARTSDKGAHQCGSSRVACCQLPDRTVRDPPAAGADRGKSGCSDVFGLQRPLGTDRPADVPYCRSDAPGSNSTIVLPLWPELAKRRMPPQVIAMTSACDEMRSAVLLTTSSGHFPSDARMSGQAGTVIRMQSSCYTAMRPNLVVRDRYRQSRRPSFVYVLQSKRLGHTGLRVVAVGC